MAFEKAENSDDLKNVVGTFPRGFFRSTGFAYPLVRADSLVTLNYGKGLVEKNRVPGDIPVYGTNGQCGWHNEALVKGPGVILGRKGMGPLGVEWCKSDFWVIDTAYYVTPNTSELDLKFFYYLTKYIGLNHLKDGTSNPSLSRDTFSAQLLPFPPIDQQKAIAHILGTLDDKIELNQQMNQTLEEMQWILFNSWFTKSDFPHDWQLLALDECMEVIIDYRGKTPKKTEFGIPLITAKIVKNGRIRQPQEFIASEDYEAWMRRGIPKQGDVVITTEAPLGEVARLNGKKVALAQRLITLRSNANLIDHMYLKFLMQSSFVQSQLHARASGSTVLGIKQSELRQITLPVPPSSEQERIFPSLRILEDKIDQNEEESTTLTKIRDVLLPKLLSGEICIREAEKIVEAVA